MTKKIISLALWSLFFSTTQASFRDVEPDDLYDRSSAQVGSYSGFWFYYCGRVWPVGVGDKCR